MKIWKPYTKNFLIMETWEACNGHGYWNRGQYEDIRFVNDNMVAVQNGSDKWGVWNLEKEILVTSCKYNNIPNDAARYYSEGYAAVQKTEMGFVDEAGQCVIPCQYDEVGDFSEGTRRGEGCGSQRKRRAVGIH